MLTYSSILCLILNRLSSSRVASQILRSKNKKMIKVQTAKINNLLMLQKLKFQHSTTKKAKQEMENQLAFKTVNHTHLQIATLIMMKMITSMKKILLRSSKAMLNSRPKWKENKQRKIKKKQAKLKKKYISWREDQLSETLIRD